MSHVLASACVLFVGSLLLYFSFSLTQSTSALLSIPVWDNIIYGRNIITSNPHVSYYKQTLTLVVTDNICKDAFPFLLWTPTLIMQVEIARSDIWLPSFLTIFLVSPIYPIHYKH